MKEIIEIWTNVEPPNSHTPNSHLYPNSHTLFGLTQMWLYSVKFSDFLCDDLDFRVFVDRKSHSVFPYLHHFLCNEYFVNYDSSFLNQKNSNARILMLESIPTMRNPPSTQIVTKYQNSRTYPKSLTFFGLRKLWLFGGYTVS